MTPTDPGDTLIACSCMPGDQDTAAELRAQLHVAEGQLRRAKRMLVRHGYDVQLADMDGGLRAALADLTEARQQRDQQIAHHVTAHDALARVRGQLVALAAECGPVDDGHQVTEYAVMVGADNLDEAPTCVESYDDQAEAEELAQHVPGAWIASRRVHTGPWVPITEDELVRPGDNARTTTNDEPKCAYCGRSRATHQIIRTHRFMHPKSPYWLASPSRG